MGDIIPKGPKKSKAGAHIVSTDNDTRTMLAMEIGPKNPNASGSGRVTKSIEDVKAKLNSKAK